MALAAAVGMPVAATVPPGQCVFGEDWSKSPLLERSQVTHDTILLTFGLADAGKPMGLSTCACILAKFDEEGSPDPIVRPYTPVSTNAMLGKFQLVVKVYPGGKMSQYMLQMPIGGTLEFKHIPFNVKIQYPFNKKSLTMLVGGTGITPMVQALHAILGTSTDVTKVSMIFGNKTQADILCGDILDSWEKAFPEKLKVVNILSNAAEDSSWTGEKGFITADVIKKYAAGGPEDDTMVWVCGPPIMYEKICGPRDKGGVPTELVGALKEAGYKPEQVFKF
mmetsp:Transcript_24038/g.55861  ORF Transcript_24038/g.55861 Transcript_24038/m.55861 type:complete len:279 (+) Transcript_24038:93-929(+)|eukprot:CAMPEP_0178412900 /NCGR_PEP_ID=MMETSP0689_2-20121128/22253_1 /TAXON_ID=160604 /ORGANISM="Amphidinium massartii, Strain CS-259" /LENGTH=278 /DNA_ID=CAMNT_0020034161 /DNA_START=86 /DNA_END=922 /DNA_ORIENTATION=+